MLNRSLDKAQAAVENHHFDMRKQLQDYDGVGAHQRKAVYGWRDEIIEASDDHAWEMAFAMTEQALDEVAQTFDVAGSEDFVEAWESESSKAALGSIAPLPAEYESWCADGQDGAHVKARLLAHWRLDLEEALDMRGGGAEGLKALMLERIDEAWQEHLTTLQNLLDGIHLRSYAQKDPKQEYKREGYEMFSRLRGAVIAQGAASLIGWGSGAKRRAERVDDGGSEPLFPKAAQADGAHWIEVQREAQRDMWPDGLWIAERESTLRAWQYKPVQPKVQPAWDGRDALAAESDGQAEEPAIHE